MTWKRGRIAKAGTTADARRRRGARDGCRRAARPAVLLLAALAICASAPATSRATSEGENLYRTLCASCHGVDGRGDGPAAPALSPPPTDLTKSTLGVPELMKVIDGRRTIRAHGDATMPVWGRVMEQALEGSPRQHRGALSTVQLLAEYVRQLEASGKRAP
ncbi:MAG: c-type cytochrome [Thermodesulfobacteriota bacterium]